MHKQFVDDDGGGGGGFFSQSFFSFCSMQFISLTASSLCVQLINTDIYFVYVCLLACSCPFVLGYTRFAGPIHKKDMCDSCSVGRAIDCCDPR